MVNYIDRTAGEIRRRVPPEVIPEGDTASLFRLYALLALTMGPQVTREDVHNAWATWMLLQGQHHESLVPYQELAERVRREDQPFVEAIRAAASARS